jgi:flavodoxin
MKALIVYDSQFGNTAQIARTIAGRLDERLEVRLALAGQLDPVNLPAVDLLLIGCPTQGWLPTLPIQDFFNLIPREMLVDLPAAAFDTRFRLSWVTGGSAARSIAKRLSLLGARLLLPPESFFVDDMEGPLAAGEIERAIDWADQLLHQLIDAPLKTT